MGQQLLGIRYCTRAARRRRQLSGVFAAAVALLMLHAGCLAQLQSSPDPSRPRLAVLNLLVGTWDVKLHNRQPEDSVVRYSESYRWDLGGHFLRGESSDRSDGIQMLVLATHDPASDGYPFWIYLSSGAWFYLDPGQWDERTRSLSWQSSPGASLTYRSRCVFAQPDRRQCQTLVKDWKGRVLLDNELSAVRRAQ